jgi:tRNA(Leu) C34 or U34 (ribose-2'-O)-methylase TrmL
MGAEGKGLRQKTMETCTVVARLPLTGQALASLNVSNAAVLGHVHRPQHVAWSHKRDRRVSALVPWV